MAQTQLTTKRLDGKIAVITGGNSGIGLATAQQFIFSQAFYRTGSIYLSTR